jgi:hypothetical protein
VFLLGSEPIHLFYWRIFLFVLTDDLMLPQELYYDFCHSEFFFFILTIRVGNPFKKGINAICSSQSHLPFIKSKKG